MTKVLVLFLVLGVASAVAKGPSRYSTDGSQSDVQRALDNASAGSVVTIPAGTFSWSGSVTIRNDCSLQGAGADQTTVSSAGSNSLLSVSNKTPFTCSVSGITWNTDRASGNNLDSVTVNIPALIHDCIFLSNGGMSHLLRYQCNGGVIWNCTWYDQGHNEQGINFKIPTGGENGESVSWSTDSTLGTLDHEGKSNTYCEDCTFVEMVNQAVDFDDNSRVVMRHCTFDNSGGTSHGLDTGPWGMRQWEVYENTYIFTTTGGSSPSGKPFPLPLNYWFYCRGGTGVVWGNTMPDLYSQMWGHKGSIVFTVFNVRRRSGYIPCQTEWQAIHQVGQGVKNGNLVPEPVYVWGNRGGTNYDSLQLADSEPDDCGNGLRSADFIKLNRDVYLGQARPDYTPYPYPHPLRTGGGPSPSPTPSATPSPSASPSPSATPTPSPTPTPPPSGRYSDWLDNLSRWIEQHPAIPNKP